VSTAIAYGSLILTVALVLTRPRLGAHRRVTPAMASAAGAALLFATGIVGVGDFARSAHDLWRPALAVASIMISTSLAHRTGIFDRLVRRVEKGSRGGVSRPFSYVFLIGATTAALLNNDAAILLLTPMIVPMIARLYPRRQYLVVPFAFAVFMSAGVAPLSTSNPMNLVVAERAGIGFNAYAVRMIPVAAAASIASFLAISRVYRKELDDLVPATGTERGSFAELEPAAKWVLGVLVATLLAYPLLSAADGPVWIVAVIGAGITSLLCLRARIARVRDIAGAVAYDVLVFVFFMFVIGAGLRKAGIIESIAGLYELAPAGSQLRLLVVGLVSALGSALLNNHSMSVLNLMSLESVGGDARSMVLAALVGGDLGPRFLPIGSLAGLLWIDSLQREGVEITLREFARVGVLVTLPALAASLATLAAVSLLPW
jgi:arsenical pump membrane protein